MAISEKDNKLALASGANAYVYDLNAKKLSAPYAFTSPIKKIVLEDSKAVYLSDDKASVLSQYNAFDTAVTFNNITVSAVRFYNNNLYIIDAPKQQIYKSKGTGNAFGIPATWIKDKKQADLSKVIDLAIDGDIYALTSDGKILKFYSGALQEFSYQIAPSLIEPTKIETKLDYSNLYILDKTAKKIVILDKKGQLVKQLLFESLPNLNDFCVNEKDKMLYLISDNKIYSAKF